MKKVVKIIVLLGCVVFALTLLKYYLQTAYRWMWKEPTPKLISGDYQLTSFSANKQIYHLNEDIVLSWEIKKISENEKDPLRSNFCPCSSLFIINQYGQKIGPSKWSGCDTFCAQLKPGETWGGTVTWNLRKYAKGAPFNFLFGQHKIYLELNSLVSKPITVTVIR